ncbi:MAG: tripartite tricarboxylate transporter substrate binding protein [Betaproteobacteria bacterium]|nr:tripartite tricarboxylate transporter substrate binding protein [Betaproteobacteria bacterium]
MGLSLLALIASAFGSTASAQSWPARPIRYIVPFPPGGGTDTSARLMAPTLSSELGQQVVIENRPGAGGMIGVEQAAKAAPDGYTMVQATVGQVSINPNLLRKLAFDPDKDLAPVALTGDLFNVLVVHPALPVRSVLDLVALARKRPGELNFSSSGVGVPDHLAGELFQIMTGTKMVHVPYKGGPLAMADLVAGNVQLMFATVASSIGMVKANKLRPIAITNGKRFPGMPQLPIIGEAGIPGFAVDNWTGVFVPAGTPKEIITRLNAGFTKAVGVPATRTRLLDSGIGVASSTPEQFATFIQKETAKWKKVIADANVRID